MKNKIIILLTIIILLIGCNLTQDPSIDTEPMVLLDFNINTEIGQETEVDWNSVQNATNYTFGYAIDPGYYVQDSNMTIINTTETSISVGVLSSGNYIGRLTAINGASGESVQMTKPFIVQDTNNFTPSIIQSFNAEYNSGGIGYTWNYGHADEITKIEIQASLSTSFGIIEFEEEYTNKTGTDIEPSVELWKVYYIRARAINTYGEGNWNTITNGIQTIGNTTGGFWIDDNNPDNVDGYTKSISVSLKNDLSGTNWEWIKIWRNSNKTGLIKSFNYTTEEPFNLDTGDGNKTIYIETGIDNGISVMKEASIILDTILIGGFNYYTSFYQQTPDLRIFELVIINYNEDLYRFKGDVQVGTPTPEGFVFLHWLYSEWVLMGNPVIISTSETNEYGYRVTYEDKAGNTRSFEY